MNLLSKILEKYEDTEFTTIDGYDRAVIGVCTDTNKLVFSQKKIIKELKKDKSLDEALDYFYYNIINNQKVIIVDDEF